MNKAFSMLMVTICSILCAHAMENPPHEKSEASSITTHQRNLEKVIEHQQNILLHVSAIQQELTLLKPMFDKFLKSAEVVAEEKKKKFKERMTQQLQSRITQAGNFAVQQAKTKWKIEKSNNYRLHRDKLILEITRATDEGRTNFIKEGVKYYEPLEILIESKWMSVGDFRKERNELFDQKQAAIKKALLDTTRKKAENEETRKIYKEQLKEIDQI